MGTNSIDTSLVNDLAFMNMDVSKNQESNEDFIKAFDLAFKNSELENLANRNIDVQTELPVTNDAKTEYLKENSSINTNKTVSSTKETAVVKNDSNVESKTDDEDEIIENALNTIINEFASILEVSPEEIQNYITENDIDITLIDTNELLQDLIVEFTDINSPVEILTDSASYEKLLDMKEVVDGVKKTLEEADLTLEDVKTLVDSVKANVSYQLNEAQVISKEEIILTDEATEVVTELNVVETDKSELNNKSDSHENETSENMMNSNSNASEVSNDSYSVPENNETPHFVENPQEIYDQIGEYIRNLSSENIQEIEMKLQPETLGTIQVKVTQSEGAIKAEFVTTNESVKSMLEGQLIQLKEDFERSGLKVDDVEVKVSTNAFNENTDSESRDDANEAAQRMSTPRRINLVGLDALEELEEIDEEEKVVVEMMTANGNSLDYKA